jgi:hypothetical protein
MMEEGRGISISSVVGYISNMQQLSLNNTLTYISNPFSLIILSGLAFQTLNPLFTPAPCGRRHGRRKRHSTKFLGGL